MMLIYQIMEDFRKMAKENKKEKSKEEIKADKEKKRTESLENLKNESLKSLAVAYHVKQNLRAYGDETNKIVEMYLYRTALGDNPQEILGELLGSREGDELYSGQVSESRIINRAAAVQQESLLSVTVGDILEIMGIDKENDTLAKYKDYFIGDLSKSKDKEEKEAFQSIVGGYQSYFIEGKVIEAYEKSREATKKSLEQVVDEEGNVVKLKSKDKERYSSDRGREEYRMAA